MTESGFSAVTSSVEFFTIVARNYLAHAFVLGESVARHHPDARFSIFLMDDVDRYWKPAIEARGFKAIYPEEIPLDGYRKFVFQYNVTEASTGVKPFVFRALFERGAEKVVYLDPDILCFRRFDEVLSALDRNAIVLTPHICSPAPDDYYPGEKGLMSSGVFNLGFVAVRQDEVGARFLRWWSEHLKYECIAEPDAGLFVDQKWIDLVPGCFDSVDILRSRAYNIAYWNLHERVLEERGGILFERMSGEPVAFLHFSGIALDDLNSICKYAARNPFGDGVRRKRYTLSVRADLAGPFDRYKQLLISADMEGFSDLPYAYGTYDNGERISDLERSLFRASEAWSHSGIDPFETGRGSFHRACRRAGVRGGAAKDVKCSAQEAVRKYGGYMRFIQLLIRCCLLILGPQRYLQFAKYMRHQLLPFNHGFLLDDGSPLGRVGSAEDASLKRGDGRLLPEAQKSSVS